MSNASQSTICRINLAATMAGPLAALCVLSSTAQAQPTETAEEVFVIGIRNALKESLETKRNTNSIIDVINAEDIGKFPDKNVAESLSRLTGISVSRDFGEGEKVSVRGSSPIQNRTLLNGSAVASTDWFVLDNPSRAFNYTLLPSDVISTLEVYKTAQADIQEGSLGGTIYLRTHTPLTLEANTFSVQIQEQFSDKSGVHDPLLSGLYSWKNTDETLGVLISVSKHDRTLQRDGLEALGFHKQPINDTQLWQAKSIGSAYFYQERKRQTALASLQYNPSEKLELTLNYLDSEMSADNINHNLAFWGYRNGVLNQDTAITHNNTIIAGTLTPCSESNPNTEGSTTCTVESELSVIDRQSYGATNSVDMEFKYHSEGFTLSSKLGHTKADGGTERDRYAQFNQTLSKAAFDARGETVNADFIMLDGREETQQDIANRRLTWLQEGDRLMNDEESYFGADFSMPVSMNVINRIKVGVHFRDHDKGQTQNSYRFHWHTDSQHLNLDNGYGDSNLRAGESSWFDTIQPGFLYADILSGESTPGNFLNGIAGTNSQERYPIANPDLLNSRLFPAEAYSDYGVRQYIELANTWQVNEKISALYFKADFEGEGFRGDAGFRYVETDLTSWGYQWQGDPLAAALAQQGEYTLLNASIFDGDPNLNGTTAKRASKSHVYNSFLPSLNLTLEQSENHLWRLAASRTMSRPDYISIAFQESHNFNNDRGSRGNPLLNPTYASNFDVGHEWYFTDEALLAATFFLKDINGPPSIGVSTESRYNSQTGQQQDITFTNPVNGRGYKARGIEFTYQQEFGYFGVIANTTFSDIDHKETRQEHLDAGSGLVAGHSNLMYNITGYFENNTISSRLSYSYRSRYYDGISLFNSERFSDGFGQLDAIANVKITENMSLALEIINLTNEIIYKYHQDTNRLSKVYSNGRRFVFGANIKF